LTDSPMIIQPWLNRKAPAETGVPMGQFGEVQAPIDIKTHEERESSRYAVRQMIVTVNKIVHCSRFLGSCVLCDIDAIDFSTYWAGKSRRNRGQHRNRERSRDKLRRRRGMG
jgi:hypothetical protein